MFFASLHSVGIPFSSDMPWLSGPRHCGQFEPLPDAAKRGDSKTKSAMRQAITAHRKVMSNIFMI
jgi:hypothetical protein